jgi:hypothetical protein
MDRVGRACAAPHAPLIENAEAQIGSFEPRKATVFGGEREQTLRSEPANDLTEEQPMCIRTLVIGLGLALTVFCTHASDAQVNPQCAVMPSRHER